MDLPARRPFHHDEFALDDLVARKGSTTISVCPRRTRVARSVGSSPPSADPWSRTARSWTRSSSSMTAPRRLRPRPWPTGAKVVSTAEPFGDLAPGTGKGEALWRGLAASTGDLVVFCDHGHHRLRHPLHRRPRRTVARRPDGAVRQGLLRASRHPRTRHRRPYDRARGPPGDLAALPVAHPHRPTPVGEYRGARRTVLERVGFVQGYGVDLGLLVDVERRGVVRPASPRSTSSPDTTATAPSTSSRRRRSILQTAFARAGLPASRPATLRRPGLPPLSCAHVSDRRWPTCDQRSGGEPAPDRHRRK